MNVELKSAKKILLVDDEVENLNALSEVIRRAGWNCVETASPLHALQMLRQDPEIAVLISDLKMPQLTGLELLQSARLLRPDVSRALVTAYGSIEETVEAMRAGAFDVLTKPLKSKNIKELIQKLLDKSPPLSLPLAGESRHISESFARVMDQVKKASSSKALVLFTGESGTGKTFLAKKLHLESERAPHPFVILNCAAMPHDLLEAELFGVEKGSFAALAETREGKILAAQNGTLLLDEIGDLCLDLQAKLLQFIQEKKFFPLGSRKEYQANVRILATTHRNLDEMVRAGKFREDLLYRLRVIEIEIPALRERRDDLFWLVPFVLDRITEKNNQPGLRLTHGAFKILYQYSWPGNIRELENVLEGALIMASDEELREGFINELSLPQKIKTHADYNESHTRWNLPDLATLERQAIMQALVLTGGNRRLAASMLGISERTLYRALGPGSELHNAATPPASTDE